MPGYQLNYLAPIVAFLILLYFQLPTDMKHLENDLASRNRWQRLTKRGKGYVIASFFAMILAEVILIANRPETPPSEKHTPVPQVVKVPYPVHDTQRIKEKSGENTALPTLELIDDSTRVRGKFPDSLKFRIVTICPNGAVYHIVPNIIPFFIIDHKFVNQTNMDKVSDFEQKSFSNQNFNRTVYFEISIGLPKDYSKRSKFDTSYFFYRATYTDKEFGSKLNLKLRAFYKATVNPYPTSIKDIKISKVVDQRLYGTLKQLMMQNKYW